MPISLVVTICIFMIGIICSLVGLIYKILADRISIVTVLHSDINVDISAIKTDLKWIKQKLLQL